MLYVFHVQCFASDQLQHRVCNGSYKFISPNANICGCTSTWGTIPQTCALHDWLWILISFSNRVDCCLVSFTLVLISNMLRFRVVQLWFCVVFVMDQSAVYCKYWLHINIMWMVMSSLWCSRSQGVHLLCFVGACRLWRRVVCIQFCEMKWSWGCVGALAIACDGYAISNDGQWSRIIYWSPCVICVGADGFGGCLDWRIVLSSCEMVAWLAETIALDVTCSCHQKPSNGKQRVWWLAPPCSSSRVCLFLGESAGRNRGHGFERVVGDEALCAWGEREVVIYCELILSGIVNGIFSTTKLMTL